MSFRFFYLLSLFFYWGDFLVELVLLQISYAEMLFKKNGIFCGLLDNSVASSCFVAICIKVKNTSVEIVICACAVLNIHNKEKNAPEWIQRYFIYSSHSIYLFVSIAVSLLENKSIVNITKMKNNEIKNGLHSKKKRVKKNSNRIHHTILKHTKTKLRCDRIHSKQ